MDRINYKVQTVNVLDHVNSVMRVNFYYNNGKCGVIQSHGSRYLDVRNQLQEQMNYIMGFDSEYFEPYGLEKELKN